jgi:cytochrome oxidase Cu insertion factor (SCO1/SenC/PrrC family)
VTRIRHSSWTPIAVVVALVASCLAHRAQAQAAAPALPDIQKLGPQVGARVPDFTLTDQQGRARTLTSLLGSRGLMLVFFRSADW